MAKLSKKTSPAKTSSKKQKKQTSKKSSLDGKHVLENISTEDFMSNEFDQSDSEDSILPPVKKNKKVSKKKVTEKQPKESDDSEESDGKLVI